MVCKQFMYGGSKAVLSTLFLVSSMSSLAMERGNVLCADIGGTRIKAAILRPNMLLDQLKAVAVVTMSSKGWFNESLPKLFDKNTPKALAKKFEQSYDRLSFGITGPVMDSRLYINPRFARIPRELAKSCQDIVHVPVSVENDAAIWALGSLYWQKLTHNEVQLPCLCITLGTGIGIALLKSPTNIILFETSFLNASFRRLHELSQEQQVGLESGRRSIHSLVGIKFFQWAQARSWDETRIERVFNDRVGAFCEDMQEYVAQEMGITIASILVGGGNSRFILCDYLAGQLKKEVAVLSPELISSYGISPDIISLLGCVSSSEEVSVSCVPSLDHILGLSEK